MTYLNKQDRKSQIIEIAKQIVLDDGLNSLTVRYLASKAQISVGQVHHHFGSVSELKSAVFLELVAVNLCIDTENPDVLLLLTQILGFDQTHEELSYLKLWNDAEQMMDHDAKFKPAYQEAIQLWHHAVKEVLLLGLSKHKFNFEPNQADDIAWRLIAASCGLESIYNLDIPAINAEFFQKHIHIFIQNEIILISN